MNKCAPRTEVYLSICRNSDPHVFSGNVVIFCMLNIPEISIRCPEDICWVKRHVKWSSRIMPHSGIFPPLAEEYVHAVLLKFVINTTISSLK